MGSRACPWFQENSKLHISPHGMVGFRPCVYFAVFSTLLQLMSISSPNCKDLCSFLWDPLFLAGCHTGGNQHWCMMFILTQVENWIDFDTNPLYAIMHEAIYCQVGSISHSVGSEPVKHHTWHINVWGTCYKTWQWNLRSLGKCWAVMVVLNFY